MQAKLYKLRPLEKQIKKVVTGNMNEEVEICGHLYGKSVRHICWKIINWLITFRPKLTSLVR